MSNLIKRTIFGAIYVALVVCSLLFFRPYFFQLLFLLVSSFAVWEFHRINHSDRWLTLCGIMLSWLMFVGFSLTIITSYWFAAMSVFVAYGMLLILTIVLELYKQAENPIYNWGILFSGQVLVALPFALMNYIYDESPLLLLSLFIIIWTNDTGAYCVGSLLGKHRMAERISPKKSWEGFAGGAVFAMVAGYILLSDPLNFTNLHFSWWQSIVLSLVIVVFGTLGDLIESLTKRTLKIKDSGNVIPGHGGLLDRFDSILLATPAMLIALIILSL